MIETVRVLNNLYFSVLYRYIEYQRGGAANAYESATQRRKNWAHFVGRFLGADGVLTLHMMSARAGDGTAVPYRTLPYPTLPYLHRTYLRVHCTVSHFICTITVNTSTVLVEAYAVRSVRFSVVQCFSEFSVVIISQWWPETSCGRFSSSTAV